MTREEKNKLAQEYREKEIYEIASIISPDWCKDIDCEKCYANSHCKSCQYIERAKCLYDKGYRNQTDLLKEFVEWLKERLKEQYTRLYNGEGSDIVRSIGVHIVMSNLDTYLEKFLDIENELAKK